MPKWKFKSYLCDMQNNFEQFGFNKQILNAIEAIGYTDPTLIQQKAIPPIINGQDVLGIAQTGTGKTAAYLLPIIKKLGFAQDQIPRAVILAPTRELAMQIEENTISLCQFTDLRIGAVYGGLGPKPQKEMLAKGIDILIATPGRLLELYLAGDLVFKKLQVLVLDEADKMLDMGFIGKINRILEVIPKKRQNLLFSATMSDKVEILVGDFLLFPTKVEVSLQATPAKNVEQRVYMVPNLKSKINLLYHFLLDEETFQKVIVFCKTKTIADNVYHYISRKFGEDQVKVIHANKGQNTRINSMEAFKEGSVRVLVGTDVASRGIDVTEVTHVINFDVPLIYEDYVHRIGRTGRAEKLGVSITFSNESETLHLAKIEKLIRQKIPVLPIPDGVIFAETSFNEKQAIAREIDEHKRKEDPTFKGSFHEKKFKRPSADEKKKLAKQKEQQLNKGNAKSKTKSSTDDKTKKTLRKKGKNWDKKIK